MKGTFIVPDEEPERGLATHTIILGIILGRQRAGQCHFNVSKLWL